AALHGPAADSYFATTQNASLSVSAASGLLAAGVGNGLAITASDTLSAWGASVSVSSNGSFTYNPGTRFRGLADGEVIIDRFSYTVTDGQGHTGTATASIPVTGGNDAPTAGTVVPSSATPSLYLRASTTTQIDAALALSASSDPDVNDILSLVSVAAA